MTAFHSSASAVGRAHELILAGRSVELAALPSLDPTTWMGAIQANVSRMPHAPLVADSRWSLSPPVDFVCAVMMVKDEEDIIAASLDWLYCLGIRKFVIIDNLSADATPALLQAFRAARVDAEVVTILDPIVRYIQSAKTTGMMRFAQQIWPACTWIMPVDADEFLIAEHGLDALRTVPEDVDVVVVPKCHHFGNRLQPAPTEEPVDLFAAMPVRSELHRALPKVLLRARDHLTIGPGNHGASSSDPRPLVHAEAGTYGLYYREFSVRSYPQFKSNVINGGLAIRRAEEQGHDVGGLHWKNRYAGYLEGGEPWLRARFERIYLKDPAPPMVIDPFPVTAIMAGFAGGDGRLRTP